MRRVSSVVSRMSTPIVTMARTLWSEPRYRRITRNSTAAPTTAAPAIPTSSAGQKPMSSCRVAVTYPPANSSDA
jgi:hypothetical protein